MRPSTRSHDINTTELRAVRAARRRARHRAPAPAPQGLRRKISIRWNTIGNTLILLVSVVLSLFFVVIGSLMLADYRWIQKQVVDKEEQLAALHKQRDIGRRRLAVLTSDKGREQLLLEHGYLPPGDRFLLFPATPEEQRAAAIPKNDLSPSPVLPQDANGASAWQRAGQKLAQWWNRFRS